MARDPNGSDRLGCAPHRTPGLICVALLVTICLGARSAGAAPGDAPFPFVGPPAPDAAGLQLVVIDPGHGGTNLGAPSRAHRGKYEKTYTLIASQHVADHLRRAGVTVVMTRTSDQSLPLKDRISLANRLDADVFVSVHLNSSDVPGPTGHETFFLSLDATDESARRLAAFENHDPVAVAAGADDEVASDAVEDILLDLTRNRAHTDAETLAQLIQKRLTPRSPYPNRGVKQAPFFVLMGAAMPAVVVELGFINHRDEGRYVTSADGLEQLATGLAEGILDYGRLIGAPRAHHPPPEKTP